MAQLIGEEGPVAGKNFPLENERALVFGRDPDEAEVVLEDASVSRRHFQCTPTPEGFLLENLSDTNPVTINGSFITEPTSLKEGDKIGAGSSVLRFSSGVETAETAPEAAGAEDEDAGAEEEEHYDTIFGEREGALPDVHIDLTPTSRWLFKVVGGASTGAEYTVETGKDYLIGTDADICDIIFHDLSVSRRHARLYVLEDDTLELEDLGSRNGVLLEGELIEGKIKLEPNQIVTLGTSSFVMIDIEGATETIVSVAVPEAPAAEGAAAPEGGVTALPTPVWTTANLIIAATLAALTMIVGIGTITLFRSEEIKVEKRNFGQEIRKNLAPFHDVRFTFNEATGKLFLLGHVLTSAEESELLYGLETLDFVKNIDNHSIVDEFVTKEQNQILEKRWPSISMTAPAPGKFVISGYLKTKTNGEELYESLQLHFPYINRLANRVVVEGNLIEDIVTRFGSQGFRNISVSLWNGEIVLKGFADRGKETQFNALLKAIGDIHGVRIVRNFVVILDQDFSIIDLSKRYAITGYTKKDEINVSVVINGRIVSRGDKIDGMTITSIRANTIFLEKDGIKYKIHYNK